ncbi:hypothetical protein B0T16DRAFT_51834 [Cercophora newfieldiana]|uniref:Uncharacterized protein n=1 Tax=Cercophora newfieldiana TaxID=92897 RepID=A0AA39YS41_9PEZI|nr:hypothetical protein B0T16DRAFT_51834 [Cercophora newfieldiana]
MAVGLDKLEKRLERLEKYISKKKRDLSRGSFAIDGKPLSPLSLSAMSDSLFRTFPQPSFIRPTSTRMLAREEVSLTCRPEQRSQSLPETSSTHQHVSLTSALEGEPAPSSGISQPPQIPKRSSSLSPTRRPASLASLGELLEFSFANPPRKRTAAKSPSETRSRSGSISPKAQLNRARHSDDLQDVHPARYGRHPITPPPSAEHDKSFPSTKLNYQSGLPATPPAGELTPEPSPKFERSLDYVPGEPQAGSAIRAQRPRSLDISTSLAREAGAPLRRSASCSPKSSPSSDPLPTKIVLTGDERLASKASRTRRQLAGSKEPSVSDFLSLSDEDVAGDASAPFARLPLSSSKPPSCALPPNPPGLVLSPQVSAGTRLLTLSPPLATRPATAAAFEAARIAARYKFDLVYVVNLWPSRIGGGNSSLGPRLTTEGNVSLHSPRVEMTGRLLAAYGLPFIKSPFRISESVHLKVLRTEGWLEYRCENVTSEEFSRGYSCSFYTGHSLARRSKSTDRGVSKERKGLSPNRGIVFAAYKLPRADGCDLQSDEAELASLRMDAETLVNMLIDIHMTQRQRRPMPPAGCLAAGAGTLPTSHSTSLSV